MKNHSPTLNINLGNFKVAQLRREAYIAAAKKEGLQSVGAWIKKHMDKLANFKDVEKVLLLVIAAALFSGCAHQPTGADKYAEGIECEAAGRPYKECDALRQQGLAQALRDANDGIDYGFNLNVNR